MILYPKSYISNDLIPIWEREKVEREEITTLSRVSKNGRSLKTTVPMSIVKHLKLIEKDKLKWEISPKGNDFLITVEPLKKRYRREREKED